MPDGLAWTDTGMTSGEHRATDPMMATLSEKVDGRERRRHPRQQVATWIRTSPRPEEAIGRTFDLSISGASIELDTRLDIEIGDYLELDIFDVIRLRAKIARVEDSRIGVEFVGLQPCDHRRIANYLTKIQALEAS